MDEEPGTAAVELAKTGAQRRVGQVGAADVREEHEAVGLELAAAVRDLGDGGIDVRQGQRCQQAESAGVVDDRPATGLVHLARQV